MTANTEVRCFACGHSEGDARKIAAYDEMLEEVKQTLDVLDEVLDYGYLPADSDAALLHRIGQLKTIVAKAEGRDA